MRNADDAIARVWDLIDGEQSFVVDLTRDLVRIPTVNPKFLEDPRVNRESELQDFLETVLEKEEFALDRWEVFPGRPNLIGEKPGSEERSLVLSGHVDVVPVGDRAKWHSEPFGAEIVDGKIFGRGAVDMKGGLAACIAACRALRLAGLEPQSKLAMHCLVDEEAGGFGAMDAIKRGKLAKAAIIAEPTWGDVLPAEGGLEWVRVTIFGKSAHAGWRFNSLWPQAHTKERLEPGVNAIELAVRFLNALRDFEANRCRNNYHELSPPGLGTINPGVIIGGAGLGEDGLPQVTSNPAIIPDVTVMDFDYKFLPNENSAEVRKEFEDFVYHFAQQDPWLREHPPQIKWQLGDLHFASLDTPLDHPIVKSLIQRKTQLGAPPQVRAFEAVCDAAHYAGAGVDGVIFGPNGDGFHGDNECVEIESLVQTTKVIAATILDWCDFRESA